MPIQKNLGQKCRYTEKCPQYNGDGIPDKITLNLWRNVFCYRGIKGWSNCQRYNEYNSEGVLSNRKAM
jgi:hypothetical protein